MDNQNQQISLEAKVEAILFYTAEPMSLKKLSNLTKTSVDQIKVAVEALKSRLEKSESGVRLLTQHDEVVLGTAPEIGSLIEQITRDEISKELSKASLETLAIICYKGPLTRSDVDYIRGVNSTFIIRNLLIRGIVEKLENPRDSRAMLYGATFAALEYMGVTKKEDLPQYAEISATLSTFSDQRILDEEVEKKEQTDEKATETSLNGDADERALMCDADSDGIMSEEECEGTNDFIIHETLSSEVSDFEADISEENITAPSYIDEEIIAHTEDDESEDLLSNTHTSAV